jgi:hypothetical protein
MPKWLFITWQTLEVMGAPPDVFTIACSMLVPDKDTEEVVEVTYRRRVIAKSANHVLEEGRRLLFEMAWHEINEHLLLDGARWVELHKEGAPTFREMTKDV